MKNSNILDIICEEGSKNYTTFGHPIEWVVPLGRVWQYDLAKLDDGLDQIPTVSVREKEEANIPVIQSICLITIMGE
jgi:hypothetical protein